MEQEKVWLFNQKKFENGIKNLPPFHVPARFREAAEKAGYDFREWDKTKKEKKL